MHKHMMRYSSQADRRIADSCEPNGCRNLCYAATHFCKPQGMKVGLDSPSK
jgi:hypothetical protein